MIVNPKVVPIASPGGCHRAQPARGDRAILHHHFCTARSPLASATA
jgi:hypothetical protein